MTAPDVRAQLHVLIAAADIEMGDQSADPRAVAWKVARRAREIALAGQPVPAPLETEAEAFALPAVRAVFAAFDADPGAGKMAPHNLAMLTSACTAAGVEPGAYELRILSWLASWEPATCAVIAGLIGRAAAGSDAAARAAELEELSADILSRFTSSGDGERARVGRVQLDRWRAVLNPAPGDAPAGGAR